LITVGFDRAWLSQIIVRSDQFILSYMVQWKERREDEKLHLRCQMPSILRGSPSVYVAGVVDFK
jgi:hypothetical protein